MTHTFNSPDPQILPELATISLERDGHVLLIGLNRAAKRNSFDRGMLADLARAYALLEADESLRAGVLFAHGDHFTAGLDLVDVAPAIAAGQSPLPEDGRDPWRLDGTWTEAASTPLVAVAHGWCMTLGIELLLAADIRIAAADTRFSQLEVRRGIYPFGGATIRLPREAGWGNAMRWLLTGDEFDAREAHRIGLVQEVANDAAAALARARDIAHTIADRAAPLGVRATLESAHLARTRGEAAAVERLRPVVTELFASQDAAEGVRSFIERRDANFSGR
ncbi:crotonase/enoyl-CoA hydratase family protein [Mycobacterium sherrisii]|uniref:Enoyl-CoA hydratase n=1 Tax=Mycobacterium sherrisii TaxID=243061 RepID=A0A1E3SZ70_9MYCO|nr:crotonase/enoyl-CoA hydratase family protein [Mycobacterium sherrisii]MEC4762716.1 crotonase/enoyl-CoA hydratase family protein [Mycobacterium sherrisii]ODR07461.1 enoyl-CoA hydratase [Mycobacterium sherrisii]